MPVAAVLENMKLSERSRARHIEQNNQQQTFKPHDIRSSIPLVDYTNAAKFPPYQFREYPKMPLLDGNQPIRIDDTGTILTFYDKEDEEEFRSMNPEIAEIIDRNTPTKTMAEALAAKDEELSELRSKLLAAGLEVPEKGRKPVATTLKDVVRQAAGDAAQSPATNDGNGRSLPSALKK